MLGFFSSRMISPYIFGSAKNFNVLIRLSIYSISFIYNFATVKLTVFKAVCSKIMTCTDSKQTCLAKPF